MGPDPCPEQQLCRARTAQEWCQGEQTSSRAICASHLPAGQSPGRPRSWAGAGLQQGDLAQTAASCELLAVLTQPPPSLVPWHTLGKDAGAESSRQIQCPATAYLAIWQAERISLRLIPQPGVLAQGTACTTALGSPKWEVREGGGGDSWTSLKAPRHQHGVLTKLALSAVIHPHPLGLVRSAAVNKAPSCLAGNGDSATCPFSRMGSMFATAAAGSQELHQVTRWLPMAKGQQVEASGTNSGVTQVWV